MYSFGCNNGLENFWGSSGKNCGCNLWSEVNTAANSLITSSATAFGILDILTSDFLETKFKGEYRLAPLDSKLYAIKTIEEEIIPPAPKNFNIYGDPI